jgi:hypothetical protein
MKPIKSSNLTSASYNEADQTLDVAFNDENISSGKHLNRHIKKFACEKL